jgi:predicted GTPase
MADIVIVAKTNSATAEQIAEVTNNATHLNPGATIVHAESVVTLDDEEAVTGKRVVVVEDGPTLTHGGMPYGAGYIAAKQAGAAEIVDPWGEAVEAISRVKKEYPHIGALLPAMGYSAQQLADLETSLNRVEADTIVAGTPVDLTHVLNLNKPVVRARYDFAEASPPALADLVKTFLQSRGLVPA